MRLRQMIKRVTFSQQCLGVAAALLLLCGTTTTALADAALDLTQYRGKVVVLDFWASWCVPCRRSFPWMNRMHEKYADDGLVIIGVNLDSDQDEARAFLDEYPAQFHTIEDPTGELAKKYDVIAMPSSYVFDRDGKQLTRHLGFKVKRQNEYEDILLEALHK